VEAALKSYIEASNRYHKWWDMDLDKRLDIQKAQKDMESEQIEAKKEEQKGLSISDEAVWHYKQSSNCHVTDKKIALIQLSAAQLDAVSETYKKLDLDAGLAIVQGNAALVQGNLELAESAYRQALLLEDKPSVTARLGLALYFADQGEWRFADPLFAEAFSLDSTETIASSLWFDNARSNGEDTLKKAMSLKTSNPQSSAAHFLALREASILQNEEALSTLGSDLLPLGSNPTKSTVGAQARSLVVLGKVEEAQKLLSAHPSFANTPEILVAQADIAAYSGDSTMALNLLKKAAQRNPSNPAVALFLR
jgi:tetratricopeptide (TPR) repeat protein